MKAPHSDIGTAAVAVIVGEGVLERSEGTGDAMKLTVKFESGTKTLQAKFLTELV